MGLKIFVNVFKVCFNNHKNFSLHFFLIRKYNQFFTRIITDLHLWLLVSAQQHGGLIMQRSRNFRTGKFIFHLSSAYIMITFFKKIPNWGILVALQVWNISNYQRTIIVFKEHSRGDKIWNNCLPAILKRWRLAATSLIPSSETLPAQQEDGEALRPSRSTGPERPTAPAEHRHAVLHRSPGLSNPAAHWTEVGTNFRRRWDFDETTDDCQTYATSTKNTLWLDSQQIIMSP